MALKSSQLEALFARRREAEHNRIERTNAVNKYYDHWGKVTARFENWTGPEYYKQAEKQLEKTKKEKEKQKRLVERQDRLTRMLQMEKNIYELEVQEKMKRKNHRRSLDTQTLANIDKNLKEQQQLRRKLELEAKLYGKWRHGVDDENLLFESKSDHEVLAKLSWLDKQVNQQLQREKEEEAAKERELKLQQELNRSEELQKERQQIREKEISEIRCIQECHLEQLKEKQKETDGLKEKEKILTENINSLKKELELLEECQAVSNQSVDFNEAYNFNKIKVLTRKRSEVYRNQLNICLSITERALDFAEKPEALTNFKKRLEKQLDKEAVKISHIEAMYESEAKHSLKINEAIWQQEHAERCKELRDILLQEYHLINTALQEVMQRHDELLEMRSTHLGVIENSTEKLKVLVQEEESSPRYQKSQHDNIKPVDKVKKVHFSPRNDTASDIIHNQFDESADTPLYSPRRSESGATNYLQPVESHQEVDFSSRRNCNESSDSNISSNYSDINRISNSFNNINLDVRPSYQSISSQRSLESHKTNSQRTLQIVTPETEADRPRFGRKRVAWN